MAPTEISPRPSRRRCDSWSRSEYGMSTGVWSPLDRNSGILSAGSDERSKRNPDHDVGGDDADQRRKQHRCAVMVEDDGRQERRGGERDQDRTSGVSGKSVSVRVDLGGRRVIKKKKQNAA